MPPDIAGSARLGFEGLDTLAQAYLNGTWIGRFENMFREYAVDVKARLAPAGEMNTLIVIFSSPLRYLRSTGLPQNDPAFPGHKGIRKLDGEESRKSERSQKLELSHCGFLQSEGQRRLMATSSPGRGAASRPLFRRLAKKTPIRRCQVQVLPWRSRVQEEAKPQAEGLAFLDFHAAEFALVHRLSAEGIRHHQAIVPIVEPARTEIRRVRHEGHAHAAAADDAGVVAPVERLAPGAFGGCCAGATGNAAAVLLGDGSSDADAQAHLLLVAKDKVLLAGLEGGIPDQQVRTDESTSVVDCAGLW